MFSDTSLNFPPPTPNTNDQNTYFCHSTHLLWHFSLSVSVSYYNGSFRRPEALLTHFQRRKKKSQNPGLVITGPIWRVDWMNRSLLVGFAQPLIVDANSVCRVGGCLQLCQFYVLPAHSWLLYIPHWQDFSQQYLAWLQCSKLFFIMSGFFL